MLEYFLLSETWKMMLAMEKPGSLNQAVRDLIWGIFMDQIWKKLQVFWLRQEYSIGK